MKIPADLDIANQNPSNQHKNGEEENQITPWSQKPLPEKGKQKNSPPCLLVLGIILKLYNFVDIVFHPYVLIWCISLYIPL